MASEFKRALDFIELAEASKDVPELHGALARVLDAFGVPHYTLGAMVRSDPQSAPTFTTLVRGVTQEWSDHYWDEKFFNADAAVHLAMQQASAFSWSHIENSRLNPSSRRLFDEIRDAMHIRGGFVIPVHDDLGFAGIIALHHEDAELPPRAVQALKLISIYGVERAKELFLIRHQAAPAPHPCPLSARQREILAFAAQGKSENDTAQILGISSLTVREHIVNLRTLLGVRSKMQAVAIAVQRGWIML